MTPKKLNIFIIILVLGIFAFDMYSKWFILQTFDYQPYPLSESVSVIGDFFKFTYVQNYGITFGLFNDLPKNQAVILLTSTSSIALFVLAYFYINIAKILKDPAITIGKISLAMIFGGAMGNIIDRIIRGFVVDFLDFGITTYRWYTFNMADVFIVSGCLLLSILLIFFEQKKDPPKPVDQGANAPLTKKGTNTP